MRGTVKRCIFSRRFSRSLLFTEFVVLTSKAEGLMKRTLTVLTIAIMASAVALPDAVQATTFLSDGFEAYTSDADLTAAGWAIVDANSPIETSTWTITNPGARINPPTSNGTASSGNFMISDSDTQSGSNTTDSGMSHDIWTPSFSTAGSSGDVWLHADTSAVLNDNGAAILFVDVSTDAGDQWNTVFERIAPGRGTDEAATTFLPDNTNADGFYGRLDVNLGAVGGQDEVRVRIRHYEPSFDWWIAVDNVVVDDVAPLSSGGATTVFSEDFSSRTLGGMLVDTITAGGELTWTTLDGTGSDERYIPGTVAGHNVNRLMHPAPKGGAGNELEFAIIDSDRNGQTTDDYLMTPVLDLRGQAEVFLSFDSEGAQGDGAMEVLLMQDVGGDGPDRGDPVLSVIIDYKGGLHDTNEDPLYAQRIFEVPGAAGLSNAFFAWRWGSEDDWWWAVDNVQVTANPVPEPSTFAVALLLGLGAVGCSFRKRRV